MTLNSLFIKRKNRPIKVCSACQERVKCIKGKEHNTRAYSVHPGTILTDLSRHISAEKISASGAVKIDGEMTLAELTDERKTPQGGAATIVWSAVSSQLDGLGGVYIVKTLTSRL